MEKLIFVLKLDECQVVKGQRLERVSLTLMNRALEGKQLEIEDDNVEQVIGGNEKRNQQQYYGVQSEKNIWWQSAWALPHESHDTLRCGTLKEQALSISSPCKSMGKNFKCLG